MSIKTEAIELINNLDENSTWEDLMYSSYIRQKIHRGLQDIEEKKVISHEELKKKILHGHNLVE